MRVTGLIKRFRKDEKGSATVEFVLWVPVFVLVLTLIVDASALFSTQAKMLRVASDTTRNIAMNVISTTQAEEYVAAHGFTGENYTVSVNMVGDVVRTELSIPISDAAMTSLFSLASDSTMKVAISQRLEPTFLE